MPTNKLEWKPLTLTPVNFSLTEGTSIPAPPDSPPETPRPRTDGQGPLSSHPTPKSSQQKGAEELAGKSGSDSAAGPMSPTSPTLKRPGSVRKFLGLRSMSSDSLNSERPGSPATISSQPSISRSKSGSWFGSRKKTFSMAVGTVPEAKESSQSPTQPAKPKGPPPPALPELKTLGVDDKTLSLGADDMFKNI